MYFYLFVLPCLLLALQHSFLPTVFGVQVMYEHFRQINGTDLLDASSVRIRKLNRTTSAMNGTFILKEPLDNSYKIGISVYYSRLGNNQFIHYPMKVPSIGVCDFFSEIYPTYYPYLKEGVVNFPPTTECPLTPKVVYIRDYVVSPFLVPPFVPKGLWRVRLTLTHNEEAVVITDTMSKLYSDLDW
ncbi:uncharacterized protein LOC135713015 [Ochlerotatus camptorhynchus]|uniref:uncharacterized protein LOC135713015 n=1 Tax=Ochlerotatus camptorhynchus TaxID=644619 RepID=UPI0031D622E3